MVTSSLSDTGRFLDEAKSLACVHCGLCLGSCPTYLETGNENDSPRGRIYLMRAVQEGRLPLQGGTVRHIDLCLGCRACEVACPSGVQYGELLESTRDHIERHHGRSLFQWLLRRVAIEGVFPHPARLRAALGPARLLRALGLTGLMPRAAREAIGLLPTKMSTVTLPELSATTRSMPRGRLGFVSGCVMSMMFGRTNQASVELLNAAGYDVYTPRDQACCGALYAHGGRLERARAMARRNIEVFEKLRLDAIIINAAGCGSTLKEYGHLLREDALYARRAESFSRKVKDLTEWLVEVEYQPEASSAASASPVTYHDACHLAHPQRITAAPRRLIQAVVGESYVELPESDLCCGSAGSYNLTEPEMAERLQDRKIENILRSGARTVVTTNPGCLLQIQAGLRKAGAGHIRALHIADFLRDHVDKEKPLSDA